MTLSTLNPGGNNPATSNKHDIHSDIETVRKLLMADTKEHPSKQKFRELFDFIKEMRGEKKSIAVIARHLKVVGIAVSPATLSKWIDEEQEARKHLDAGNGQQQTSAVRDAFYKAAAK